MRTNLRKQLQIYKNKNKQLEKEYDDFKKFAVNMTFDTLVFVSVCDASRFLL